MEVLCSDVSTCVHAGTWVSCPLRPDAPSVPVRQKAWWKRRMRAAERVRARAYWRKLVAGVSMEAVCVHA